MIEVIGELTQKNDKQFPIIDSNKIRGGIYQVQSIIERNNIPNERRKNGMLCYVEQVDTYYKLEGDKWVLAQLGSGGSGGTSDGIPVYDQEMIDAKTDMLPEKYISIPNKESDLNGFAQSREIEETGSYVDILFQALRKLQSEVARLKNSFRYGIYSYTDTNTAMSETVEGYELPDEEPLWSIEEEDLSEIFSMELNSNHTLSPLENVDASIDGILSITNSALWQDESMQDVTDPKMLMYLTTSSLNIDIGLSGISSINLNSLGLPTVSKYDILVLISRQVGEKGLNYIWISISNNANGKLLGEGYFKDNVLYTSQQLTNQDYYISSVTFNNLQLSKFKIYTKYQDFSKEVIPSKPTDEDYKYSVAHITIRSVKNQEILKQIQNQLPNNELIWEEYSKKLWIKTNDTLVSIGGGGSISGDEGMTESELIDKLKELGIVQVDGQGLSITDISDLTFIHQGSGQKYKFQVDSQGQLYSQKVPTSTELLSNRVINSKVNLSNDVRGFIGQLRIAENNLKNPDFQISKTQDAKIYSDRLKIGAFYAPYDTDTVHGCSHSFIELENTADCDFALEGCYLHFTKPKDNNEQLIYHLPLTGTIKAGSTYLIRGKGYNVDSNTVIKVDTFDQEWFANGELVDFTINTNLDYSSTYKSTGYGFALTYGNENLSYDTPIYEVSSSDKLSAIGITSGTTKYPYIYDKSFIDAIYYMKACQNSAGTGYWAATAVNIVPNSMYRNTFELDPAKQAFQALNTTDSSRNRWANNNDIQVLRLGKDKIEFPKTEDTYPINKFTPLASTEGKNVSTDKSKLNLNKPNMVTCSFGLDIYTERCFNWVSAGDYDEYIWIKQSGDWTRIESYKTITQLNTVGSEYPRRKEYSVKVNNTVYARLHGIFPGDGTAYTSHKVVAKIVGEQVSSPTKYTYICGRADKNGNPDLEHCSNEQYFTLYPTTYMPRIYQITDQQGFHWIEYQVWSAAANKLLETITNDITNDQIIPILINTGDMTQNGTRINEWLDYYNAGRELFSQFEQMNVVGNNDLCGSDVSILGTGDDVGKSNSYYFHVFYCYDIDEATFVPIVNDKYIPSLYYFDSQNCRFVMVNSEITEQNCKTWYNLIDSNNNTINIYTGFTIGTTTYNSGFTSIYTMLYNILNTTKEKIVACHEMPYTVITNESIATGKGGISRSISNAGALVGSHLNQISPSDTSKGIYWFSRLLEYKGVKLCIGGHKHTYAITYPVREYFLFGDGLNSKDNYSSYTMEATLQNDTATFINEDLHLTKFPLTKREDVGEAVTGFYPYTPVPELTGGVIYFMCQATGYKLTSNKELPSANQKFSFIVPQTINKNGKDSASSEQKYPMFAIINLETVGGSVDITAKLVRIKNIFTTDFKFNQVNYGTANAQLQYLSESDSNNYGVWGDTKVDILHI